MPNTLNAYIRTTLLNKGKFEVLSSQNLLPALLNKSKFEELVSDSSANSFIRQATPDWINGILQQREMVRWCAYWFVANVLITFYNKIILSSFATSPTTNAFVHLFYTFIGCLIVQRGKFPRLNRCEFFRLLFYSFIFALNISWFQFSMKLTSLSLNQATRTMTPLFQALFSYFILGSRFSTYTIVPLICLCIGPAITFDAELNLTFTGLMVSLSSIVISALKGALSMKILRDLRFKLQEYSLLIVVAPLASIWMLIFKAFVIWYWSSTGVQQPSTMTMQSQHIRYDLLLYISFGGVLAFAVNTASIGCVKRTSATSLGVMAQGKQSLIILSSMFIAERDWTYTKLVGVAITLAVAALYAYQKEKQRLVTLRQNAHKIPN